MAMIGLQLYTGQRIDVDAETDFSLKSSNPFFCVGINELSHTQDFSVPATKKNNLIFNIDNSVIAEGWRRGRGCWLIYSAGEIEGKLYIKDYNKGRYNVLFIWGAELDDILTQPVSSYLSSSLDIYIQGPKPSDRVDDFGWVNYNEVHYDPSFNDGMSLSPSVNLGWLMSKSAQQAGYNIRIDGQAFALQAAQYNPNNYGFTLDRCESGTLYHLGFGGFAADLLAGLFNNYQLFDENNNPVALGAGGLSYDSRPLPTTSPGNLVMCLCFTALRQVRLRLTPDSNIVVLSINGNSISTEGNGGQFPYVEYNEYLTLSAGQAFTILHANDFDIYTWSVKNNGYTTPVTYSIDVTDSETTASVGDTVYLDSNLPDKSLLDLVRDWCLISSSYFEIDPETKTINIYTIERVVGRGISNNIIDIDSGERDILSVGSMRRYIDGFSQHNNTVCDSADYVSDANRYRSDYPCDNDLLDESSDFGVIGFNDGNIIGDGEAVFDNFQPLNGGGVEMKASCGIFFFDPGGGAAKHLRWVEGNYGMHNTMSGITSQAVSIVITIRETMMQYLSHNSTQLWQYGGCLWVAKDYTWKGNATQMELVKVDGVLGRGFIPTPPQPQYEDLLYIEGTGTQYIDTLYYPDADTEVEYVCEQVAVVNYNYAQTFFGVSDGTWSENAFAVSTYRYGSYVYGDSATTGWGCFTTLRNVEMSFKLNKNGLFKDGILVRSNAGFNKTLNLHTLSFFAANYNSVSEFGKHKLKIARIRQNGVVVREYVPKRRISDGVVGLLELNGNICPLSGTNFFINAGSGDFLFG